MPNNTDMVRHYDHRPGKSLLDSLANPPATAVASETWSRNLAHNGKAGTGPGNNTGGRPAASVLSPNPAPSAYKFVDAIKDKADAAAIPGSAVPAGLVAAAPTGTSPTASVALSWQDTPGAASYKIAKKVGSGAWGNGTPATGSTLASTQTGLSTGTVQFRITSVAQSGKESSPSNVVTVTIP